MTILEEAQKILKDAEARRSREWFWISIGALLANIVLPLFLDDIEIIRYVLVLGMCWVMFKT